MAAKLKITQVKSQTGYPQEQKMTIRALGFKKLYQTLTHKNTPQIRGMIAKVKHLVKVEVENK